MAKGTRNKTWIFLLLILLLGLLVRLWHLDSQDLWLDEALSIHDTKRPAFLIVSYMDTTPPLYNLLLHFWIVLGGMSVWWVRLFSVLFGVGVIFLAYLLAQRLFDKKTGLIAACLIACAPVFIYYSQEARAYSLLFFLVLASMYFYLRLAQTPHLKWRILYLIATALMLYSHLYAIFIVVAQNADMLWRRRHSLMKSTTWMATQALLIIIALPWLWQIPSIASQDAQSWIPSPTLLDLVKLPSFFFEGVLFSFSGVLLTLLMLTLAVWGWRSSPSEAKPLLGAWIALPIAIPFLLSLFFSSFFYMRYTLIAALPLFLLAARPLPKRYLIFGCILLLSLPIIFAQQNTLIKEPWGEISKDVRELHRENDSIGIMIEYDKYPFAYYHKRECISDKDIEKCLRNNNIIPLRSSQDADLLSPKNALLIVSHGQFEPQAQAIWKALEGRYDITLEKTYTLQPKTSRKGYDFLLEHDFATLRLNDVKLYSLAGRNSTTIPKKQTI